MSILIRRKQIQYHTTSVMISSTILLVLVVIIVTISLEFNVESFSIQRQQQQQRQVLKQHRFSRVTASHTCTAPLYLKNDALFTDISVPIRTTDGVHTSVIPKTIMNQNHQVFDKNGNEFVVNCVVRVSTSGIKAYQVNSKGYGSFNEQKEFIPDTSDSKKKCLLLPVGLRGIVKRVYDEDVISSNLPIVVMFTPGEHTTEEGYDTPTKFMMHFTPYEVEVVV